MYRIIGTDGRQYGPVSLEQIRQWIAEGRVESHTPIFAEGAKEWSFAGRLPEFANYFATTTPPPIRAPGRPLQTSGFATAGLVCGIFAWVCCCCCGGFPFNLFGLVFSLIGLSQTGRHPENYKGRGEAIAGLVLSLASLLLGIGWWLWNLALHPPMVGWDFKHF
jgi:Domain of unknown function (DUF4190)/GYF domain 2